MVSFKIGKDAVGYQEPLRKCFIASDMSLLARLASFAGFGVALSRRASARSSHAHGDGLRPLPKSRWATWSGCECLLLHTKHQGKRGALDDETRIEYVQG